jgi:hypothetical protein
MSTYRMDDGTIIKTVNATQCWEEAKRWDGSNHISVATGSQWGHEMLHRSRNGRYYIEHTSQYQGTTPYAEWVSNHEAARWLLHNGHELPEELAALEEQITESRGREIPTSPRSGLRGCPERDFCRHKVRDSALSARRRARK